MSSFRYYVGELLSARIIEWAWSATRAQPGAQPRAQFISLGFCSSYGSRTKNKKHVFESRDTRNENKTKVI